MLTCTPLPSSAPITPATRPLNGERSVSPTPQRLLGLQKSSSPKPNYSGDFGEFASFVFAYETNRKHEWEQYSRLYIRAWFLKSVQKRAVDLLLVGSGDIHDRTSLLDGGSHGSISVHEVSIWIEVFMIPHVLGVPEFRRSAS